MMDVEKYGVVGLLFVAGILGLVLFFGPDEDADASGTELKTEAAASRANPGAQPAPRPGSRPATRAPSRVEFADGEREAKRASTTAVFELPGPLDSGTAGKFDFGQDARTFATTSTPPASGRCTYVIQSGDILGTIADRELGSSNRVKDLLAWNPGLDPRRLRVDQVIRLCPPGLDAPPPATPASKPAAQAAPKPASKPAASSRTYTVKPGDVLSVIAESQLGSSKLYTDDLFQANRHLMNSPDQLAPGMVLTLPKVGKLADG